MKIKDSKVKLAGGAVIYYMNYTNFFDFDVSVF